MKTWINSTNYVSTSVVDNIIKKIKMKTVVNEDIDKLLDIVVNNLTVEKRDFEYIDVSFTGSCQQKLLLTISGGSNPLNNLKRNVVRFCDYLKDDIRQELDKSMKVQTPKLDIIFVTCVSDTVEDVFTLVE